MKSTHPVKETSAPRILSFNAFLCHHGLLVPLSPCLWASLYMSEGEMELLETCWIPVHMMRVLVNAVMMVSCHCNSTQFFFPGTLGVVVWKGLCVRRVELWVWWKPHDLLTTECHVTITSTELILSLLSAATACAHVRTVCFCKFNLRSDMTFLFAQIFHGYCISSFPLPV